MSLRRDIMTIIALAGALGAGLWLWEKNGMAIWAMDAFSYCL